MKRAFLWAVAFGLGLYLAATPLLYYRYRVHNPACPCHQPSR